MRSLHGEIMNLPIGGNGVSIAREALTDSGGVHIAYKIGHRDARHAAAELANKYDDYHERLVAQLAEVKEFMEVELTGTAWADCRHMAYSISKLLAALEAEKGGEL